MGPVSTHPGVHRRLHLLATPWRLLMLVLACSLALLGAWAQPGTARAAEGLVAIHLDQVSPAAITANGTITISGRVVNTSRTPMSQVQVSFWRSTDPIQAPADFDLLLNSAWDVPIGARIGGQGTDPEKNLFNLTDEQHPSFQPDESREFTVQAQVSQLGFTNPGPGTVFLVGVHVRAIPEGDGNQTVGRSRVFLPWQSTENTARVAPVVQLSSAPAMAVDGTLVDDHLAGELNGRLATLLRAAELPGATVLVDPAMIDELRTMAEGYVVKGEQVPDSDPRARDAASWLQTFDGLKGSIYRLPYGNPDLSQAVADARTDVVQHALTAMPKDHPMARLPVAVWPSNGGFTPAARKFLEPLAPRLWVEPSRSPGRYGLPGGSSLLAYDPDLTAGGPGPDPRDSAPQREGRLVSELVLTPRPLVLPVRDHRQAATALGLPDWVGTTGLDEIPTDVGAVPATTSPAPIPHSDLWERVDQVHHRVLAWHDLTGTVAGADVPAAQLASRAANPLLLGRGPGWLEAAAASIPTSLDASEVSIQMAPTFVMGDTRGVLPVTITNPSGQPVRVKVQMTSDNAQRITIPDTPLVTVPARSSVSVQFTPRARSNGVVEFTAQAVTEGGRPVGRPRRFSINATNFGRVGWLIIVGSGAVVLGGTAIRIKQVQKERRQAAAAEPVAEVATSPRHDTSSRPHP